MKDIDKMNQQKQGMRGETPRLSSGYFKAEKSIWITSFILLIIRFVGVDQSQPLPKIGIKLSDPKLFPHVVLGILVASIIYIAFEWKLSSEDARGRTIWRVRASLNTVLALIAMGCIWPIVKIGTRFESISPFWLMGFCGTGLISGFLASELTLAALIIRSKAEAKLSSVKRVPMATRGIFMMFIPALVILLIINYVFTGLAPMPSKDMSFMLSGPFYCLTYVFGLFSLFPRHDQDGKFVTFKQMLARFKEINVAHDYSIKLYSMQEQIISFIKGKSLPTGIELQKQIREKTGALIKRNQYPSKVQALEEFQLQLPPALNPLYKDNESANAGKMDRKDNKGKKLKVRITYQDPQNTTRDLEISLSRVEEILRTSTEKQPDKNKSTNNIQELVNRAINKTIEECLEQENESPVIIASMKGDSGEISRMIKEGVNVNIKGGNGWTPLLYAAANGDLNTLRILLDAGAKPELANLLGITPLLYGANYGNLNVTKMLLDYGARPDTQDMHGDSPLMVATRLGHKEIAEILLKKKSNLLIRNLLGKTALDLAEEMGRGQIARLIRLELNKLGNR